MAHMPSTSLKTKASERDTRPLGIGRMAVRAITRRQDPISPRRYCTFASFLPAGTISAFFFPVESNCLR